MRTPLFGQSIANALARTAGLAVAGLLALISSPGLRADQNVQLVNGTTITISVIADGTAPFGYQWQRNGFNIPGANQSSLVLSSVTSADVGNYTAVVSNSAGTTTSDIAVISPAAAPTIYAPAITQQPASQSILVGEDAVLIVMASGTAPLSYQWKKDGFDIPGATNSSLAFEPATAESFGSYTVVISNAAGFVESSVATITDSSLFTLPPFFSLQLTGQTAQTGDTVTFSLPASGTLPITYQWRINGTTLANSPVVSGADTSTLILTGVTPPYSAQYSVIATNSAGSVSSNVATLTVTDAPVPPPPTPPTPTNPNPPPVNPNVAPVILTQPVSVSAAIGENVAFNASASAIPDPTYQWQMNGVDLLDVGSFSGARTPTLTIYGALKIYNNSRFQLVVTNPVGTATSNEAILIVRDESVPMITKEPVDQIANVGSVAFFTVGVSAYPNPTFQWRKNGVDLADGGNILGANRQTLSISNLTPSDQGNYSVFIRNKVGTALSTEAKLSTDGTPAFNGQPAFVSQPAANTVTTVGAIVRLTVSAVGDPAPTLQWRKNGVNLTNGGIVSGTTTTTLTLNGVSAADAGTYTVIATNSLGSITSDSFVVAVLASNVWNQPATTGKDVALSYASASGSIQWQVSADFGGSWSNLSNDSTYSGVTSNTLHVANVSASLNTMLYRLVTVTDGKTTVLHSARLNVADAFVPFPVAVTTDGSGNLYVADVSKDTVEKINSSFQITTLAGSAGQAGTANGSGASARFNDPSGLSAGSDGTLAVADKANGTIRLISPAGVVSTLAGSTTLRGNTDGAGTSATFSSPLGVARDSAGTLYVADAINHTVRKITSSGTVSTLAGSAGQSGTNDGTGSSARFNNPTGIEVDSAGNVYVADTTNNLIRKITPTGAVTTLAGLGGVSGISDGTGSGALFNQPNGLAVDSAGNVYVADTGSSTIRRISPAGLVVTVAGLPGISGHKDGVGIEAWFNQPRDITVSSTGNLYIADTGNASIRQIDQAGTVTTLALAAPPVVDNTPTQPLPTTPTLPTTPSLPTLPTSPTAPSQSSGGGGGGAPSLWFYGSLIALALCRLIGRRTCR